MDFDLYPGAEPSIRDEAAAAAGTESSTPNSNSAKTRLTIQAKAARRQAIADYANTLDDMSRSLRKADRADQVQADHVQRAAKNLGIPRTGRAATAAKDVGILVSGAGLGYLGNVAVANDFTAETVFIFMFAILLGLASWLLGAVHG